jgi:hypothetical protein
LLFRGDETSARLTALLVAAATLFGGVESLAFRLTGALDVHAGERAAAAARDVTLHASVMAEAVFNVSDAERGASAAGAGYGRCTVSGQVIRSLNPFTKCGLSSFFHAPGLP